MNEFSHPEVHRAIEELRHIIAEANVKLRSWNQGRDFIKHHAERAVARLRRHADDMERFIPYLSPKDRLSTQINVSDPLLVKRLLDNGWIYYRGEGWYGFAVGEQIVDRAEVAR